MSFGFLVAAVDFDGITHGLEGMEGQADRQGDLPEGEWVCPDMGQSEQVVDIIDEKVVVFEDGEYADIGDEAHGEKCLASLAGGVFHQDAGGIIDDDDGEEDEDIGGDEGGVEKAGYKDQEEPAPFMGDEVVRWSYDEKENEKSERVKNHEIYLPFAVKMIRSVCTIIFRSTPREMFSRYIRSYFIRSSISSVFSAYPNWIIPQEVSPGFTFRR